VSGKGSPLIADVYTIDHNRQISMKKASDGANTHDLIGSAVRALDPIFTAANIGSEFASSQLLTERASAQLAMAAIEPLGSTYSATIAAASAAIRDALKPSLAMQAVLDSIRPIKDMHKQLFQAPTISSQLRAQVAGLTQVGHLAKEMASVQSLLNTSALADTKSIREMLGVMEPLASSSRVAAELAAITTANTFSTYPKMAELLSLGSSLLTVGSLAEVAAVEWDKPASSQLLSTIAAAAETLRTAPVPAPHLTDLPDASNDVDGGQTTTQQQLQGELADAASTGDLSKLSPAAKAYFKWFCWFIGLLATYLAAQNAVREELCFLQPKILPGMTAGQMGKTVRREMCAAAFIPDGDFRFVRGESVRFRAAPSTKATILPVHLVDGQMLEVLDASNPDWLHVTVVAGGAEGWVSRKYTRKFALN